MALIDVKQIDHTAIDKDFTFNGTSTVTGLPTPTSASDAATKGYADSLAAGLDPKESVRFATSDAIIGTYATTPDNGRFTAVDFTDTGDFDLDGNTVAVGDRILVKNQGDPLQNGIYEVDTAGAAGQMTRSDDHDGTPANEVSSGNFTFVELGASFSGSGFVITGDGELTLNTDAINWTQYSAVGSFTGGDGIDITGSTVSVDLEAAGAGEGGLAFDAGELRVLANTAAGIELTASGVAVDLEAAGAGTGGLTFDAGEVRVDIEAAGAGAGGLELVAGGLAVVDGDGIEQTASGIAVDLEAAGAGEGGLAFDSGEVRINVEAAGAGAGGLELVAGGLAVVDGDGIEQTASGIAVDLEAAGAGEGGLAFDSGEVRVNIEAAGAGAGGLELVAGGLAVLDGAGLAQTASGIAVDGSSATFKEPVRAATTASITLATDVENGDTLDGVSLTTGDRILIKDQGTVDNGIYIVQAAGAPVRADDMPTGNEAHQIQIPVAEGTTNEDTIWRVDADCNAATVGTDTLVFVQAQTTAITAGDGIDIAAGVVSTDLAAAGAGTGGLTIVSTELAVIAGDGIELTASGVAADLEAAGAGEGGLAFDAGEIRVLANTSAGIELTASGVSIDLEAAGAGTGGLAFDAGEVRVDVGPGVELTAAGVELDIEAAGAGTGGLEFSGNAVRVDVADGLELTASGVAVDLEAAGAGEGGLAFDAGEVRVNIEAAGAAAGGLELVAGGLAVLETDGLTKSASGVGVLANGDSVDVSSSGVKAAVPSLSDKNETPAAATSGQSTTVAIAATPAGDSYVAVQVNGAYYNVGDGVTTSDFYFRDAGDTTTRAIAAIVATDVLYVGSNLGFDIEATDRISLVYNQII